MPKAELINRSYDAGQWTLIKREAGWLYFSLPGHDTPVAFHKQDAHMHKDGTLVLTADRVQWTAFDYLAELAAAGG